jgi:transketolase
MVRAGSDVTLIACGMMVAVALEAAALLEAQGVEARVLDMHTVKPLDRESIATAARETGAIVTAEEHLIHGGLGSGVAQVVTTTYPVPMRCIGFDDTYAESGSVVELMDKYGLGAKDIVAAAQEAIAAKKGGEQ